MIAVTGYLFAVISWYLSSVVFLCLSAVVFLYLSVVVFLYPNAVLSLYLSAVVFLYLFAMISLKLFEDLIRSSLNLDEEISGVAKFILGELALADNSSRGFSVEIMRRVVA